tara:strand:- start:222 stop:707 length:486 start_codon:yes stop_codon:yes gene_type:complete
MENQIVNRLKSAEELEYHHKTLDVAHQYHYGGREDIKIDFEMMTLSKMTANFFKFDDLKWTLVYSDNEDGRALDRYARATVNFTNGYYISIINGMYSQGDVDEYEIALLNRDGICYDTPLADDVVGFLTMEDIEQFVRDVSKLPDCGTRMKGILEEEDDLS